MPLDLFKAEQLSISVGLEALTLGFTRALTYLKRCEEVVCTHTTLSLSRLSLSLSVALIQYFEWQQRQWEPLHVAASVCNFSAISTLLNYGYCLSDAKVCGEIAKSNKCRSLNTSGFVERPVGYRYASQYHRSVDQASLDCLQARRRRGSGIINRTWCR
jgi:hypothetical protein